MSQQQQQQVETKNTWLDRQANTPYPIWAMSALSFAAVPFAVKKVPGVPSMVSNMIFGAIFAGAGYVTHVGDAENGAGISTAWCMSWSFLFGRRALTSMKPMPLLLVATAATDIAIYGKKTFNL
ncbi:hypothetical protein VTP01DRAFT_5350 [Rhizomucor pusillus]|uniref:uncharacterized protein n=1 Tax=Rhizomucor pusillus TaxID=4840 RepID=UPI003742B4DE